MLSKSPFFSLKIVKFVLNLPANVSDINTQQTKMKRSFITNSSIRDIYEIQTAQPTEIVQETIKIMENNYSKLKENCDKLEEPDQQQTQALHPGRVVFQATTRTAEETFSCRNIRLHVVMWLLLFMMLLLAVLVVCRNFKWEYNYEDGQHARRTTSFFPMDS